MTFISRFNKYLSYILKILGALAKHLRIKVYLTYISLHVYFDDFQLIIIVI